MPKRVDNRVYDKVTMPTRKNFVDQTSCTYERLEVISYAGAVVRERRSQIHYWRVQCSCGSSSFDVQTSHLRSGNTKSCGCLCKEAVAECMTNDLTNQTFGRLKVIKATAQRSGSDIKWLCKCSCGNETVVATRNLTTSNTKSCGCLTRIETKGKCVARLRESK